MTNLMVARFALIALREKQGAEPYEIEVISEERRDQLADALRKFGCKITCDPVKPRLTVEALDGIGKN